MNEGRKEVIMLVRIKLNYVFVYLCADSTVQQPTAVTKGKFE